MDKNELYALQELASVGNLDAMNQLIDYYLENKQFSLAFLIAERFEYFSFPSGYRRLAFFHQKGIGTENNISKAIKYYELGFQKGDIPSGYNLSLIYIQSQEAYKALYYLSVGVENNHIPSIRLLSELYFKGEGVIKNLDISINLLEKAIELGDKKSYDKIAKIYFSKQDYLSSFDYFLKGSEYNDLDAIYHVGLSYAKGLGVKQDFSLAFKYYERGANLFEPRCLYNLSLYYRNGIATNQNISLADKLEAQAYEKGFKK
ncbi:MAG: sel1 repeat family protein [Bacilli bacterium]|nr:sel1 repeat family protein [Bacilli bacterium]